MNAKTNPWNDRFVYDIELCMTYDQCVWNRASVWQRDRHPPKASGCWIDSESAALSWRYADFIAESYNYADVSVNYRAA